MHIYLSPHHDDVCYSIGDLASRQGGAVVNIFTRSQYVAADIALPAAAEERTEAITTLRRKEDLAFTRAAGLASHDLFLEGPTLIGYGSFELANLAAAVTRTENCLIPFLLDLLPPAGNPAHLYCPAGIGGHRDHVSTMLAIRRAYDKLRERCIVHLYEDLHYASDPQARDYGLKRAANAYSGMTLSPQLHVMSQSQASRKMQMIGLYASQLAAPPQPQSFTPASNLAQSMHELVWNVEQ